MPVHSTSRYFGLPVLEVEDARRGIQPAIAIRPQPPPPPAGSEYRHRVAGVEDIEYLAWRYHGSSQMFWRIADANPRFFPLDVSPGATLAVSLNADPGLVDRTRRF